MRTTRCFVAAALAVGLVTAVAAQPAAFPGMTSSVTALVATRPALQEELGVTAEQRDNFKPWVERYAELNKARSDVFKNGYNKERAAELVERSHKLNEEATRAIGDLLTADQRKRVKQIEVQQLGLQAFSEPDAAADPFTNGAQKALIADVATALKLDEKQRAALRDIAADFKREREEIRGKMRFAGKVSPTRETEVNQRIERASREHWAKVDEALSPEQRKAWKEFVGEAFDPSKLRPVPIGKE